MAQWSQPVTARNQGRFCAPSLDEQLSEDHPIRFFDELLNHLNWTTWEEHYNRHLGQPPIHPRLMVGSILYGINLKLTSSRQLEDATINRKDYEWFLEGRTIDHSTFAKFRTTHSAALKKLSQEVKVIAHKLECIALKEVATDGTRIQADSSRYKTASHQALNKWLRAITEEIETALHQMAINDHQEDDLYGCTSSPNTLPPELSTKLKRRELLEKAQKAVQQVEQKREEKRESSPDKTAKVPLSDPDARILKNKDGGFAPNYTPVITADGQSGFILADDVTNSTAEAPLQRSAVTTIHQTFDKKPEKMMGDGLYNELKTLTYLENNGIQALTPVESVGSGVNDVAYRDNPQEPVSKKLWNQLPLNSRSKRFSRKAFVFDDEADCFYCPLGKCLAYKCITKHKRSNGIIQTRVYKSEPADCAECPLRDQCIAPRNTQRRVERMGGSELFDKVAKRMAREENKKLFSRRAMIVETPFAHIKHNWGIRRFRHRGLQKVKQEWRWICTAYNLMKLVQIIRTNRLVREMQG